MNPKGLRTHDNFIYRKYNGFVMQLGISKSVSKKQKESALIMRKQTKIAAVVSAAALLALGASMTSFAASKGTWMMVDGEWYCYDKNGDAYTNVFCSSNGKEYYVGDDGQLVRSEWVEYDGDQYFVNSSGAKITNDWRLTTPMDDDSADEAYNYYVDRSAFKEGDAIVKDDSNQRFIVGETDSLEGVYCINQGYAVFRQVDILDQNEEYAIISSNTSYGLSRYDRIARDSSQVKEQDILY